MTSFDQDESCDSIDMDEISSYEEVIRDLTVASYNFTEQFVMYGVDGFTTGKLSSSYDKIIAILQNGLTNRLLKHFLGKSTDIFAHQVPSSVSILRNEK